MKKIILIVSIICNLTFAQVDSTFIKTLEKDHKDLIESISELQKQEEQIKGILLYIEEKYRNEKKRLDTLGVKSK